MLITSQMIAGSHLSASTKLSNPPMIKRVIDNAVTHNNMPFNVIMIVFILSLLYGIRSLVLSFLGVEQCW